MSFYLVPGLHLLLRFRLFDGFQRTFACRLGIWWIRLVCLVSLSSFVNDIGSSVNVFTGSFSLVQPLYVISIEELNSSGLRRLAISELHRMSTSMGIRQAGLLAENSSKRIGLLE